MSDLSAEITKENKNLNLKLSNQQIKTNNINGRG